MTLEASNEIEPSEPSTGLSVTDDVETPSTPSSEAAQDPNGEPAQDATGANVGATVIAQTDNAVSTNENVYTPNFKYKVGNSEKEISEKFRSLIKDADSEKEIRELFEKADGIELVKQTRAALKAEYDGFKEQAAPVFQEYHKFTTLRDHGVKGDMAALNAAFDIAGIDEDTLFKYCLHKIELEKNPAFAQTFQHQAKQTVQMLEYQNQINANNYQSESARMQQLSQEVDNQLMVNNDSISKIESMLNRPGFIREEAINYGATQKQMYGKDVSAQEAFGYVLGKYQPFITNNNTQPQTAIQQPAHVPPKTIPITDGATASVVKPIVKSMADLKKAAKEAV